MHFQKGIASNDGSMYLEQENLTLHVDAYFEGQDNHLVGLCWMHPDQTTIMASIS
jgi:hypothetical protein